MGMGCGANYADVVGSDFVRKTCPKQFKAFYEAMRKSNMDEDEVARMIEIDDELPTLIADAYCELRNAFEKKTKLELVFCYHDQDNGDRYDEVDGSYWAVDGVYQLTPAGKKYRKNIERKFFVTFG